MNDERACVPAGGPALPCVEATLEGAEVAKVSEYVIAAVTIGLISALVLGWFGRAARRVMLTAPEMPWREAMRWGARWLWVIIFAACALPAAIGLALLDTGSETAVWLIAAAVVSMGALMIAQRLAYWPFAGLGMATPETQERLETGEVNWDRAMELALIRKQGWVSRLMLPVTGLIVVAGAVILPMLIMPAERELEFAEWLWRVDDEIESATERLGKPQVWTDIGFEAKASARDYRIFPDGGRVKLSYFASSTSQAQVREAVAATQRVLTENEAQGRWRITVVPPEGDAFEVTWELEED